MAQRGLQLAMWVRGSGLDYSIGNLALAAVVFLATHFLLSHPWRAALVRALGERMFLMVYSLVALGALSWLIVAFDAAPDGPMLWDGFAVVPWIIASILTLISMALLFGSLSGNPALPQAQVAGLSARKPDGVFRITRHPMMFGIAIWAVSHIIVAPNLRSLIVSATMLILALVGSHLQDRKKIRLHDREWRAYVKRTHFWPRLNRLDLLGWNWGFGLLGWLGMTWIHMASAGIPAGIWKWIVVNEY